MTSLLCNVWLDCRQPEKEMEKHKQKVANHRGDDTWRASRFLTFFFSSPFTSTLFMEENINLFF